MSTSKQLRIENLRALVAEFKTAEAVARQASTAPMYLSQILNGVPSSTGNPRGVGDALARKLEEGCGKPLGWMDRAHDDNEREVEELVSLYSSLEERDRVTVMTLLRLLAGNAGREQG